MSQGPTAPQRSGPTGQSSTTLATLPPKKASGAPGADRRPQDLAQDDRVIARLVQGIATTVETRQTVVQHGHAVIVGSQNRIDHRATVLGDRHRQVDLVGGKHMDREMFGARELVVARAGFRGATT